MKKLLVLTAFLTATVVLNTSLTYKPESATRGIINKMISAINAHKGSKFTMKRLERLVGKSGLHGGDIYTKMNVNPYKVYMKMVTDPNKGTEVLYVTGEREGKALVKSGGLFFNVKLSPFSSLMTKEQHHTCLSAGFPIVAKIIGDGVKRADAEKRFDDVFKYVGDVTWANRNCYKILIEDPSWKITTYTAQKGDNMYTIASRLLIPEYSLVELNGVKNFEEKLEGRTLKVPTSYAKKTILYIDKETNFPIMQEMYDDKGIFERYEYFNVVINPPFTGNEFTEDFDEYGF